MTQVIILRRDMTPDRQERTPSSCGRMAPHEKKWPRREMLPVFFPCNIVVGDVADTTTTFTTTSTSAPLEITNSATFNPLPGDKF